MSEIETLAKGLQTAKREEILARIRAGECSASMSGIEYYPPWDQCDAFLREPFMKEARDHLKGQV